MRSRSRSALAFLPLFFSVLLAACGGDSEEATGPEPNQAPTAVIESPASDTTVSEGEEVTLEGSATDPEEGDLAGDALRWASDVDGELGTGETVTTTLTPDTSHAVTLTATDSEGATDEQDVAVAVEPNEKPSVTIESPSRDTTADEGDEVTLEGSASDPEDGTLTGDALRWASDVDGELGTGDSVTATLSPDTTHAVTLTATDSHGATGTAGLGLRVRGSFRPQSDTELSGEQEFSDVEIPEGVTVTVTGDLTLRATRAATIEGELMGNCVEAEVLADSTLAVTGAVNTACGELPDAEAPGLKLVGEGGFELEEAEVRASGDIVVATDPEASADTASGSLTSDARPAGIGSLSASDPSPPPSAMSTLAAAEGDTVVRKCGISFSTIEVIPRRAKKGEDGVERGKRGTNGSNVNVVCEIAPDDEGAFATVRLAIVGSTLKAQLGGHGGDATNEGTKDTVKARGGLGGAAGGVFLKSGGNERSLVGNAPLVVESSEFVGAGGDGGDATATALQRGPRSKPAPSAKAVGGAGRQGPSFGIVAFSAELIEARNVDVTCGTGDGGNAEASGADGLSEPAQVGGDAIAFGGPGGQGSGCIGILGDVATFTGTVKLLVGPGGNAVARPGDGGNAVADSEDGGDGGNGSAIFPDAAANETEFDPAEDGAPAGDAGPFGGAGGSMLLEATDPAVLGVEVTDGSTYGPGGDAVFEDGRGGNGARSCDPVEEGGSGGKGADVRKEPVGLGGPPTFRPNPGEPGRGGSGWGDVIMDNFGDGGNGKDGEPPGERGPAGDDNRIFPQAWDGNLTRKGENFQPGEPGGDCGRQVGGVVDGTTAIMTDTNGGEVDILGSPSEGGAPNDIGGWLNDYELSVEVKLPDGETLEIQKVNGDGDWTPLFEGKDASPTPEGDIIGIGTDPSGSEEVLVYDDERVSWLTETPGLELSGTQYVSGDGSSSLVGLDGPGDAESSGGDRLAVMGGRREGENFDLYLVPYNTDTPPIPQEDLINLTDTPEGELDPQPSPDGKRLAFGRILEEGGSSRITVWLLDIPSIGVVGADGVAGAAASGETQVAPELGFAQSPDWCPDGEGLVFIGEGTNNNPDLFRADADGSGVENLTRTPNRGEFEPDCAGEFVAYVTAFTDAEGNTAAELFRLDFGGGEPIQLTDLNGVVRHPAVEPE